ncbi:enoyl-CoA hydratase/isomerase family protein [Alkalihalophilus lindianensis]|uniref:Enoyl-CoA hydratase/isomerase family protein n=1 Tax=Alkalihalophilus lindianensis TaxID=1630542 RepID=A0ABU3XFC4_9BACI|nr:enoyl-CoA hydratase/isomerase family protein [Alkalihalophilus lindianensis]MDV2686084.1 enoyl-CoA hydratase/isomerase family protein [Alkalihalophilus lindianensis]
MAQSVLYTVENQIAMITLNRPEKLNTLSRELVVELTEALNRAKVDDEVRVVLLSANGKSFCAGGDLEMMSELSSESQALNWMQEASELTLNIRSHPKYVVCAVQGFAAGAGFSLALASDFIVAEATAKFTLSFAKVGLVPDLGLFGLLLERVPINLLKEWIAFSTVLSAEELHHKGIVNRVTTSELKETAYEFSECLVNGSPFSQSYTKSILNELVHQKLRQSVSVENGVQAMLLQTKDHKEGIQAFFEKRDPVFTGH